MMWMGDNLAEIRAAFETQYGPFPLDWLEVLPDGDLFVMTDPVVIVAIGDEVDVELPEADRP